MNWRDEFSFLMFVDCTTKNGIFIDILKRDFYFYFHSSGSTVNFINVLKQSVNTRDIKEISTPFKENTLSFRTKVSYLTVRGISL